MDTFPTPGLYSKERKQTKKQMATPTFDQLLEAGCHFGHLKRKWNPAMAPYIFMERNGIHIIDLYKTAAKIEEAAAALKQIAKSGKKVLFVATKKQAKETIAEKAKAVNMPYVIERWPGGMLTNFPTIRKAVKKMTTIDEAILREHYSHLVDKPFFPSIVASMTASPVIVMCLKGVDVVSVFREMTGVTNGRKAAPGTLRGDFCCSGQMNIVHASDSVENAKIELARFFRPEEIFDYTPSNIGFVYGEDELK